MPTSVDRQIDPFLVFMYRRAQTLLLLIEHEPDGGLGSPRLSGSVKKKKVAECAIQI